MVFDATANLTAGTYTLTATLGEAKVSADVKVEDSRVAEIVLKGKEALTAEGSEATTGSAIGQTEKLAYIYYDVLNQYGESIRTSTTINWTTSAELKKDDKSLGRITVSNGYTSFIYGSLIYVTGVHVGTGITISDSVSVGMAQAVNSVEFSGFISDNEKSKILDSLPANFAKDTYVLAYRTFDQNGNPLKATGKEKENNDLTFICDNVLLIDSEIKDAGIYTVNGIEYSAVRINPGDYADRGGEVTITAIANKTGQKTTKNFVIGSNGLLQSLTLNIPADVVAEGDQNVKIPYEAKGTDGNSITNYETIARSTNSLTLTTTRGKISVVEENDGTAGIYWSDDASQAVTFDAASVDGLDDSISIATTVIGGDSSNILLPVSDARHPVAIKSLKLNDDDNNAIVDRNTSDVSLYSDKIVYLDQYGKDLKGDKAVCTDRNGDGTWVKIVEKFFSTEINSYVYGLKVNVTTEGNKNALKLSKHVYRNSDATIHFEGNSSKNDADESVTYSVVSARATATLSDVNNWDNLDNEKTVSYKVVPFAKLSNHTIANMIKQQIVTSNSAAANGNGLTLSEQVTPASGAAVIEVVNGPINKDWANAAAIKVTGSYNGMTLTIPDSYYVAASGSAFAIEGNTLKGVVASPDFKWSALYDENTSRYTRTDARLDLVLYIDNSTATTDDDVTLKKAITVSDAAAIPTKASFLVNWWQYDATDMTLTPSMTELAMNGNNRVSDLDANNRLGNSTNLQLHIFDQYGKVYDDPETSNEVIKYWGEGVSDT